TRGGHAVRRPAGAQTSSPSSSTPSARNCSACWIRRGVLVGNSCRRGLSGFHSRVLFSARRRTVGGRSPVLEIPGRQDVETQGKVGDGVTEHTCRQRLRLPEQPGPEQSGEQGGKPFRVGQGKDGRGH